jgi:3-oxoacyl-[acyl-carrier protein] reductase
MAGGQLDGKVAIVTGAGRGIGRAIALAYGREGARVVCAARSADEIESTAAQVRDSGGTAIAVRCDVTDWQSVQALVRRATDEFGTVDVLVNDAGMMGPLGPHDEIDLDRWSQTLDVNVMGVVRACRAVLPVMRRQQHGVIVNLSGGGAFGPLPPGGSLAYGTSKAAVARFSELLAQEVAAGGIRVNTLGPGLVRTRLSQQGNDEREAVYGAGTGLDWRNARPPEDAARLAVWLASDAAAGITGKHLNVQTPLPQTPADVEALMAGSALTMRLVQR